MKTLHLSLLSLVLLLANAGCAAETSTADPDATSPASADTNEDDSSASADVTSDGPSGDPDGSPEQDSATPEDAEVTLDVDPGSDTATPEEEPVDAGPVDEPDDDASSEEQSGWPKNPFKDDIPDPGWDSIPGIGTVMPNFQAIDQYGNVVELYDFAGQGVPVVIDVGTWFCEPCKALASYLSEGDPSPFYEDNDEDGKVDFAWWNESYEVVYDLVDSGQLIWITVLYSLGDPVTAEDVFLWHEEWPNPHIPVLADTSLQLQEYLGVSAMPRIDVLNEDMIFEIFETGGPTKGMKYVSALP